MLYTDNALCVELCTIGRVLSEAQVLRTTPETRDPRPGARGSERETRGPEPDTRVDGNC